MKIKKLNNSTNLVLLILIIVFLSSVPPAQAAPSFQAAGTAVASTGNCNNIAWPAHEAGDIALLFVESRAEQAVVAPAGFTAEPNNYQRTTNTGNSGTRITVFWSRATSASMPNVTITDPGDHCVAQILTYRGVIANGTPWNVIGGGFDDTNNTSVVATGVTTTVSDTLIVVAVAQGRNATSTTTFTNPGLPGGWTNANLTGIAERTDYANTAGDGGGFGVIDGVMASTGATGNTTVTMSNPFRKAFLTIALQPPAMSTIYAINNSLTPNGAILRINPANSIATVAYSGTPFVLGTRAAGIAQCPNGMLYFIEGSSNGTLYSFNPNTPSVAPVAIGNTGLDMIRMTCHPTTGVLYGMPSSVSNLYIINTATAATTAIPMTLPSDTPPASGSGDIGFAADGTLYFVGETTAGTASTERLWIINLETNNFENVGAVTGLPNVANGIAFDNSGNVILSLTNETQLYTVSADGGAATSIGSSGAIPSAVYDLSSVSVLQLTKTDGTTIIRPGDVLTYTVVIAAGARVYNIVFTDPAVANLTVSNVTCAATGGATCPGTVTVAAMQGAGITISSMPIGGSLTFTITAVVTGTPTGTLTNTANISLSGQTNSASDTDAIKSMKIIKWREVVQ